MNAQIDSFQTCLDLSPVTSPGLRRVVLTCKTWVRSNMGVSKPALQTDRCATKLLRIAKLSPETASGTLSLHILQLTRSVQHRLHAFRLHLVALCCGAKLFRIAKLSPETSPCPSVAIQTSNVTKPSQITGANCEYGLRTPIFTALLFRRKNVFKGTPRPLDQPCRPHAAKTANMHFHSQFTGQNGSRAQKT